MRQRTFVMFKSNAIDLGTPWPEIILDYFIRPGFNICAMKWGVPTDSQWQKHFGHLEPASVRNKVIKASQRTPVLMMVIEGDEAVNKIKDATGSTSPGEANRSTIRRRYGHASQEMYYDKTFDVLMNTMHASATQAEAEEEIANFFKPEEIYGYQALYSRLAYHVYPPAKPRKVPVVQGRAKANGSVSTRRRH